LLVKLFGQVRAGEALEVAQELRGVTRDQRVAGANVAVAKARQQGFVGNGLARGGRPADRAAGGQLLCLLAVAPHAVGPGLGVRAPAPAGVGREELLAVGRGVGQGPGWDVNDGIHEFH
jgi:hypothetical protein